MYSPTKVILLLLVLNGLTFLPGALACGPNTDCQIADRTYRIKMPADHDGKSKVGAVIFNHGYRGTAAGVMRNKKLIKTISGMGLALVAPDAARDDWDIPNAPNQQSDANSELAFFDALKVDLTAKHSIDPYKIMVSGFSAGGMMTWNLACERSDIFAAFAPIAGTFWAPVPERCATLPASIIHIHGTSDKVVPMQGRVIGDTKQGDVKRALKLAAPKDSFSNWNSIGESQGLTCQQRTNKIDDIVQLCVHPGGHNFKSEWLVYAWKEFERAGAFGNDIK